MKLASQLRKLFQQSMHLYETAVTVTRPPELMRENYLPHMAKGVRVWRLQQTAQPNQCLPDARKTTINQVVVRESNNNSIVADSYNHTSYRKIIARIWAGSPNPKKRMTTPFDLMC